MEFLSTDALLSARSNYIGHNTASSDNHKRDHNDYNYDRMLPSFCAGSAAGRAAEASEPPRGVTDGESRYGESPVQSESQERTRSQRGSLANSPVARFLYILQSSVFNESVSQRTTGRAGRRLQLSPRWRRGLVPRLPALRWARGGSPPWI